jgi:hypothetical protein
MRTASHYARSPLITQVDEAADEEATDDGTAGDERSRSQGGTEQARKLGGRDE